MLLTQFVKMPNCPLSFWGLFTPPPFPRCPLFVCSSNVFCLAIEISLIELLWLLPFVLIAVDLFCLLKGPPASPVPAPASIRVKRGQRKVPSPVECIKCLLKKPASAPPWLCDNDEVLTNVLRDLRSAGRVDRVGHPVTIDDWRLYCF